MKIEILHTRDPDSDCGVRVWVDGVEVKEFYMDDLDPGRGYQDEDWEENLQDARDADTTPAFKEAVIAAYEQFRPVQKKWSY